MPSGDVVVNRRGRLAALIGLGLIMVGISIALVIGPYIGGGDACMRGSDRGSCPALADVNGVGYSFSVGLALLDIEDDLTSFGDISRTNAPEYFSETTAYSVTGIDPTVLLIARAAPIDGDEGPYRMLSVLRGDHESMWPEFCQYLTQYRRDAQPECETTASP